MELALPKLITADDYHCFRDYEHMLKQIDKKLRCVEVGFDEDRGRYIAVVYTGPKPSEAEIAQLTVSK